MCIEHEAALNQDFNLSTPTGHTVLELAQEIWKFMKPGVPFRYTSDDPFKYDVQKRVPSVEKAKKLLGFEATTPLSKILEEVVPWVQQQIKLGNI